MEWFLYDRDSRHEGGEGDTNIATEMILFVMLNSLNTALFCFVLHFSVCLINVEIYG